MKDWTGAAAGPLLMSFEASANPQEGSQWERLLRVQPKSLSKTEKKKRIRLFFFDLLRDASLTKVGVLFPGLRVLIDWIFFCQHCPATSAI